MQNLFFQNQVIDGIEIIPMSQVPKNAQGWDEESLAKFRVWLRDTATAYYARPKNYFSMGEAIRIAKGLGRTRLIAEDLS